MHCKTRMVMKLWLHTSKICFWLIIEQIKGAQFLIKRSLLAVGGCILALLLCGVKCGLEYACKGGIRGKHGCMGNVWMVPLVLSCPGTQNFILRGSALLVIISFPHSVWMNGALFSNSKK